MYVNKKAKYIRVSTLEQKTNRQKLTVEEGIKLYEDKESGLIPFDQRPAGKKLYTAISKEEVSHVVVHSLDRLGRNVIETQNVMNDFIKMKCQLEVEDINFKLLDDNGELNLMSKLVLDVMASISGMELKMIKNRQREGIEHAKIRGVYVGRKKGAIMTDENYFKRNKDIVSLLEAKMSLNKTAKLTGKSYLTVRNVKIRYEAHLAQI